MANEKREPNPNTQRELKEFITEHLKEEIIKEMEGGLKLTTDEYYIRLINKFDDLIAALKERKGTLKKMYNIN